MSHEMMFITAVDKLVKRIIAFNNNSLVGFTGCARLVSKVWIVRDQPGTQDNDHRYPQVILEVGAIKLGGLP